MRLNRLEFLLMNNPVRAASQRWVEASVMFRGLHVRPGPRVLEIGCGRGVGLEILDTRLPGGLKVGFDLDPAMVRLAHDRVTEQALPAAVSVADAEWLPFPDQSFDIAAEFGILHHVPGWRGALKEIARVLKPGGAFVFEDLSSEFSENRVVSMFLEHPRGLSIRAQTFRDGLFSAGLEVESLVPLTALGFVGRARKPDSATS